jgi:hypothetical protein
VTPLPDLLRFVAERVAADSYVATGNACLACLPADVGDGDAAARARIFRTGVALGVNVRAHVPEFGELAPLPFCRDCSGQIVPMCRRLLQEGLALAANEAHGLALPVCACGMLADLEGGRLATGRAYSWAGIAVGLSIASMHPCIECAPFFSEFSS